MIDLLEQLDRVLPSSDDGWRHGKIHATDLGGCTRKVVLDLSGAKKKERSIAERLMLKFGHLIQDSVAEALKKGGLQIEEEVEVVLNADKKETGHADWIVYDPETKKYMIWDCKSTGTAALATDAITLPMTHHVIQVSYYWHRLQDCRQYDLEDLIGIIYFDRNCKVNPQAKLVSPLSKDTVEAYVTQMLQVVGEWERHKTIPDMLPRVLKERLKGTTLRLEPHWQCKYCPFEGVSCYPNMSQNKVGIIEEGEYKFSLRLSDEIERELDLILPGGREDDNKEKTN